MADYPNSIKQFVTKIDKNISGTSVGPEYFNVPSTPYQIYLDHVPKDAATTVIGASGGAAWTGVLVAPSASGQYLVDYTTGLVTFHSSMATLAAGATYKNLGDDIMAEHVNDLQGEITAIESELGASPSGPYATLVDRLNAITASTALASGVNGQLISDGTIRAGALMNDIKGATWVSDGRPTLSSIVTHQQLSAGAHAGTAVTITAPGSTTAATVQQHVALKGSASQSNTNPHGMSLSDLGGTYTPFNVDASGYVKSGAQIEAKSTIDAGTWINAQYINASGNSIYVNSQTASASPSDSSSAIYFYENSKIDGARIGWNNTAARFEANQSIAVFGDVTASGNIVPEASGAREVGTDVLAFASGHFKTVRADTVTSTASSIETMTSVGTVVPDASGFRSIGTQERPFASGVFNTVNAESGGYSVGNSVGANGFFVAGAKTVTVKGGIIVSIV